MELILVRHGLPVRQELSSGRADPELSAAGRQQAEHVADWLYDQGIDAIYTSPMRRARETATPLATRLNHTPAIHNAIAEYDRAASHYIPMEELKREDYTAWKEFVDGGYGNEYDMATFAKTVAGGMEEIISANPGKRVAVFCHGGCRQRLGIHRARHAAQTLHGCGLRQHQPLPVRLDWAAECGELERDRASLGAVRTPLWAAALLAPAQAALTA